MSTSAINFAEIFAQSNKPVATATKAKAEYWINFGYIAPVTGSNGEEKFVSLPIGIPLDTQEHLATNSRNPEFAYFQAARNDLLDKLIAVAKTLAPGESRIICQDPVTGLAVQLRRVGEEVPELAAGAVNPFIGGVHL